MRDAPEAGPTQLLASLALITSRWLSIQSGVQVITVIQVPPLMGWSWVTWAGYWSTWP